MKVAIVLSMLMVSSYAPDLNNADGVKRRLQESALGISLNMADAGFLHLALWQESEGGGVRYAWRDKMRRHGIKEAAFLIEYSWRDDKVSFKVKRLSYYRSHVIMAESLIKDRELLREIRRSGLEQELTKAALSLLNDSDWASWKENRVKRDKFVLHLRDSETLPVLETIF